MIFYCMKMCGDKYLGMEGWALGEFVYGEWILVCSGWILLMGVRVCGLGVLEIFDGWLDRIFALFFKF